MKGVVFNVFEEFVIENFGVEFFEEVIDSCELQTTEPFIGPGTYPDSDLLEIVSKTVAKGGLELTAALKMFGKYLFPRLAETNMDFVESKPNLKEFLKSVDGVIHVEVKKLFPDAVTPKFEYSESSENDLTITYISPRNLPDLMVGLIEGAAEMYKTNVNIDVKPAGENRWDFNLTFNVSSKAA